MLPHYAHTEHIGSSVQPTVSARVDLREPALEEGDLVRQWLALSDMDPAWGDLTRSVEFFAAPPVGAQHRIVVVDGRPVGYVRWGPAGTELLEQPLLAEVLAGGATRIDVLVGPRDRRFMGVGSVTLRRVREVVAQRGMNGACIGVASVVHLAARRAYEKAGFLFQYFFDDSKAGPLVALVCPFTDG